ncbi:TPA: hypothetical protein ACF7ZB_002024 [Kluyvera georgiana]
MSAPEKNTDFDEAYRSDVGHMMWTDSNVPTELKNFIRQNSPLNALELGCGLKARAPANPLSFASRE